MNFFQKIAQSSLKEIAAVTVFVTLVFSVPFTIWLVGQTTRVESTAGTGESSPSFTKPSGETALSTGEPKLSLVWPFLGKGGDSVLIEGENLNQGKGSRLILVGGEIVSEDTVYRWEEDVIEFEIPAGAESGSVKLQIAGETLTWPYPFTVYDRGTKVRVAKVNNNLEVLNAPEDVELEIYLEGKENPLRSSEPSVKIPEASVLSVALRDSNGNLIPFYVEPGEFGF